MMHDFTLTFSEALIIATGAMGMGMILLVRGGNWTVDAAVFLARHMGVSRLIVGLTVVAFGTSLPELIVSVNSNYHDLPGLALGNVIGSNTANILLVIGATAMISTLSAQPHRIWHDLVLMLAMTLALGGLMLYGIIDRTAGILMIATLVFYTIWKYRNAKVHGFDVEEDTGDPVFKDLKTSLVFLVLGLGGIALGAEFLVRGAKISATVIGVPDAVIGLSVIAIGTSLPELSTCLIAATKKQTDIVLGNIIGSNIFNILMIIGTTALIKPINLGLASRELTGIDIWVTLAVSFIFSLVLLSYRKINRFIGIVFLGAYATYMLVIFALYLA